MIWLYFKTYIVWWILILCKEHNKFYHFKCLCDMRGLPKCYLLHNDPSEFRELGKICQATCFPLSTLNHWSFTEHTSWPSKPRLPKFPRWDSWAWIMSQKWDVVPWARTMGLDEIISPWVLDHGFRHHFCE